MSDVFSEVDEQLRAERAEQVLRRGWPYALAVLLAALVVALAVWGWSTYTRSQEAKASVAYAHALESQGAGKTAEAEAGYQSVAKSAGGYRALALMQLAGKKTPDTVLVSHVMVTKDNVCKYYDKFACSTGKDPITFEFPQEKFQAHLADIRQSPELKGFENLIPTN